MFVQSALGLLFRTQYRDVEWIALTWLGNDWLTLVVALPLLIGARALADRGSLRAYLLWLGMLGYAIYNYAYYLLGAALNVFFPLYLTALISATLALIAALSGVPRAVITRRFSPHTPAKPIGGYFLVVGVSLAGVWLGMWAAYVFAGRPTPIDPEAFKLVAALDTVLMVPALAIGGTLLWRRQAWGYVVSAIAGVQGSLYLVVLAINATIAVWRGLAVAPGEIPVWGTLAVTMSAATLLLFVHAGRTADG
jgi:hypothetical protein